MESGKKKNKKTMKESSYPNQQYMLRCSHALVLLIYDLIMTFYCLPVLTWSKVCSTKICLISLTHPLIHYPPTAPICLIFITTTAQYSGIRCHVRDDQQSAPLRCILLWCLCTRSSSLHPRLGTTVVQRGKQA